MYLVIVLYQDRKGVMLTALMTLEALAHCFQDKAVILKSVIFKHNLVSDILGISCEIALR